jgi:hypothetical protein
LLKVLSGCTSGVRSYEDSGFGSEDFGFPTCEGWEIILCNNCCSSQLMFKMSSTFCSNACSKALSPFIDCNVNNLLIKTIPFFHNSLFEVVNVTYASLTSAFLKDAPYLVVL